MDHHKTLYKDQRSHTPRHHSRINRKLQEDKRAKNRRDRFQNSRNIAVSPDRQIIEKPIPAFTGNKENVNERNPNTTRLAKIVSNATNPEKLTKQEAFIKRFVEWKESRKNEKNPEKKKPFVSCATNSRQTTNSSTLVPRGHHKGFRPPVGLKCVDKADKVEENKNLVKAKGRQSTYTIVPTPPKKQNREKPSNKFPNMRKSPPTSTAKNIVLKMAKTIEKSKSKMTAPQPLVKKDLKPRALIMPPPPPPIKPISTATKKPVGAVTKVKTMAERNRDNVKQSKKSPLKNARLAQTLKAKKPLKNKKGNLTVSKINAKKLVNIIKNNESNENMTIQTPRDFATLNPFSEFVTSTKVKESSQSIEIDGISPIEFSPKELHSSSSAKRNILVKESEDKTTLKTPKEESHQKVKRFNFLRYSETKNISDNCEINNGVSERFAVTDGNYKTVAEVSGVVDKTPTKSGPEERPPNYLSPFVSVTRGKVNSKQEKKKRDSMYLQSTTESHVLVSEDDKKNSPKYSVEVRRTLEAVRYFRKQLQDEIDRLHKFCDIWEAYKVNNLKKIQNANGEDMINVTIGQTRLLTSKKFMQFKGLIDRCEAGATGIGNVEYDGSEDTKPITSRDLEGFWSMLGLQVDNLDKRFENLNRWKENDWVDPEEVKPNMKKNLTKVKKPKAAPAAKAKPNSALQQMLRKMQVEMRKNKNKNNDMNEIIVLTSSEENHRRSASSKNSTPQKSLDPNASHRLSVKMKERKYFSPVQTIISFSSPKRRTSLRRKSSKESPKLRNSLQLLNNQSDNLQVTPSSVLMNKNSRKQKEYSENSLHSTGIITKETDVSPKGSEEKTSTQKRMPPQTSYDSPIPIPRKSILKTPGTAKSRLRNVIFNEKLRVKKFNFLINDNDENEEANDTHEEDLVKCFEDESLPNNSPERTLTLRNRKVRLRPSCEIVIPKN